MPTNPTPDEAAATRKKYLRWMRKQWDMTALAKQGEDMVFCYSVWGGAFANLPAKDWLEALRAGRPDEVPEIRQRSWADAGFLAGEVLTQSGGYRLLPWLLLPVGHHERWSTLQRVHMIGPTIAAWLLRDLSFLMDYRPDIGRSVIRLRTRPDSSWFRALPVPAQACYLPMSRWVHEACIEHAVYTESEVGDLATPSGHESAAIHLANWCAARDLDAREVNVHWYGTGSGNV